VISGQQLIAIDVMPWESCPICFSLSSTHRTGD